MIIILISWVVQIGSLVKKKKQLLPCFVGLQAIGIALLVVSDFLTSSALSILGMLNVLSALGALVAFALLTRK